MQTKLHRMKARPTNFIGAGKAARDAQRVATKVLLTGSKARNAKALEDFKHQAADLFNALQIETDRVKGLDADEQAKHAPRLEAAYKSLMAAYDQIKRLSREV
jgi:hypothetical protein